jgi:DNA-binding response OmpR family regulator
MRLLVADCDLAVSKKLQKLFGKEGIAADFVTTEHQLLVATADHRYDLLILGLGGSARDIATALRQIADEVENLPVIVISSCRKLQDRIDVLSAGADDFLAKPFDVRELLAKVHAGLRRSPGSASSRVVNSVGSIRLLPHLLTATFDEQPVALTHHEYRLLEALVRQREQVLSRTQLEDSLYASGAEVGSNTVEVYVHQLRRKLRPEVINTVRGVGYQLAPSLWN